MTQRIVLGVVGLVLVAGCVGAVLGGGTGLPSTDHPSMAANAEEVRVERDY